LKMVNCNFDEAQMVAVQLEDRISMQTCCEDKCTSNNTYDVIDVSARSKSTDQHQRGRANRSASDKIFQAVIEDFRRWISPCALITTLYYAS